MKTTTVISFLALAFATAVTAIPTPDAPGVYAVPADSDSSDIEARDPMMWGPYRAFPGENGYKRDVEKEELDKRMMWGPYRAFPGENGYKRDVPTKQDAPGQGHGFDQNQDGPRPQGEPAGAPHGMPQGPQGGPKNIPYSGPQGGAGQGMPQGGNPFDGKKKQP